MRPHDTIEERDERGLAQMMGKLRRAMMVSDQQCAGKTLHVPYLITPTNCVAPTFSQVTYTI